MCDENVVLARVHGGERPRLDPCLHMCDGNAAENVPGGPNRPITGRADRFVIACGKGIRKKAFPNEISEFRRVEAIHLDLLSQKRSPADELKSEPLLNGLPDFAEISRERVHLDGYGHAREPKKGLMRFGLPAKEARAQTAREIFAGMIDQTRRFHLVQIVHRTK